MTRANHCANSEADEFRGVNAKSETIHGLPFPIMRGRSPAQRVRLDRAISPGSVEATFFRVSQSRAPQRNARLQRLPGHSLQAVPGSNQSVFVQVATSSEVQP